MVDGDGKQDRVLVRPYVKSDPSEVERPGAPDPRASAETQVIPQIEQPAPGDPEEPGEPGPADEERDRRGVLLLVAGALALIVATVAVVVIIWPHDHDQADGLQATNPVWPTGPPGPSAAGPAAHASSGVSASASRARVSQSASASAGPSASRASAGSPPSPSLSPSTAITAPAADLTGAITGAGGHCLDAKGEIALIGSSLSVYTCNNTLSQTWTFATDGTLRVASMCAVATGDTSVHISTCGTGKDGQWGSGSGGTLVNKGTGSCLTDPDAGAKTGSSLSLATCGGNGQHWSLP
jgi:hypothetical protein